MLFALCTPAAANAAVPGPPSGWTTVFSDDFAGASGAGVDTAKWQYDTGPGSGFGTGEIETMTNSAKDVHLDGSGDLDVTALKAGGAWTVRPRPVDHLRPGHGRLVPERRVRLHDPDQRDHVRQVHGRGVCRGLQEGCVEVGH